MRQNVLASGKVRSVWTTETGRWDEPSLSYVDIRQRAEKREIGVHLVRNADPERLTVEFEGPTGYESYALADMERVAVSDNSAFCVCFGTINSWPQCLVNVSDLQNFLAQHRCLYET